MFVKYTLDDFISKSAGKSLPLSLHASSQDAPMGPKWTERTLVGGHGSCGSLVISEQNFCFSTSTDNRSSMPNAVNSDGRYG